MANRVTASDVQVIYDYDSTITDPEATIFINAANILVNNVRDVGGLSSTSQLTEIERWLSAHLIAIRDPQSANEKAGAVAQSFQYKVDLNLNQTRYGQMALILDTTGYLAGLQAQAEGKGTSVASFTVYGPVSDTEVEEAI